MAEIAAETVKQLRDATGAGMMDAKQALQESDGDFDQAIEWLRKKGESRAEKRAERSTESGMVHAYVHMDRVGAMVEVQCETDFVARTDDFQTFVHDLAMQVTAAGPRYVRPEDIPEEELDRERSVYVSETEGKPEDVKDKIIEGKLEKYYEQVCLLKQPFIKDPDKTIEQYQTELIAKLGENVVVKRFAYMELGSDA